MASIDEYRKCSIAALQPWIGQVFGTMFGELSETNAEAKFLSPRARVARISPTLVGVIFLVTAAIEELSEAALADYTPRIASRPKLMLSSWDTVDFLIGQAAETSRNVTPTPKAAELIRALKVVRSNPAATMALYEIAKSRLSSRSISTAFAGIHFTLGHEISHHLLSHGHSVRPIYRAPGNAVLDTWIESKEIELPYATRQHMREHRADALSVLLGAHTMGEYGRSGMLSSSGAFVAILALSLTDDADPADLFQRSKSHPSFAKRCAGLLEVVGGAFEPMQISPPPGLDRELSGRVTGYSGQILFLSQVLAEFLKPQAN